MDSPLSTRVAVLQVLRVHRRSHGAAIIAAVREATAGWLTLHDSTVYPLLRELARLGLVEECDAAPAPERMGRPGRVFALTAMGQKTAEAEARALLALLGVPDALQVGTSASPAPGKAE